MNPYFYPDQIFYPDQSFRRKEMTMLQQREGQAVIGRTGRDLARFCFSFIGRLCKQRLKMQFRRRIYQKS